MNDDNSFLAALVGSWKLFAVWIGSVAVLQHIHLVVGICSGLVLMGYTLWKWRREAKEPK
jgi:hypothetical protein